MNIYVASSWRNSYQQGVVNLLRSLGHEVYDFRNPPESTGFSWADVDPNWECWTPEEYRKGLQTPLAEKGYASDIGALCACDVCVLVLPSGRSASWELGYAMGKGKKGVVYMPEKCEPELMYREAAIVWTSAQLLDFVHELDEERMRCPRRGEMPSGIFKLPEHDVWRKHPNDDHETCSYCGSMRPEEFMAALERGEEITPTDKGYKAYLGGGGFRKFYYPHLDDAQKQRFVEMLNEGKMKIAYPGHFYVLPYFIRRDK